MPTDARKTIGRRGEQLAAEHFARLGWEILARNHHTRFGELDIVALDGETLVFAEVKTCRLGKGQPWESLHERKRSQVRRMAQVWLRDVPQRPRFWELRCDAVGVVLDARGDLVRLDHLRAAF
jgi:putative endonuclease